MHYPRLGSDLRKHLIVDRGSPPSAVQHCWHSVATGYLHLLGCLAPARPSAGGNVLGMQNKDSSWGGDPTIHRVRAASGITGKATFYVRRYGLIHATVAFLGRKSSTLWRTVGPIATRPYLRRWLRTPGPKIASLGGGGILSDSFLCADLDPRSDVYVDLERALPFPNCSIDAVFMEEAIEHISHARGQHLLRECARVLTGSGRLRISTPDLDYLATRALEAIEHVNSLNDMFYNHGHRHIYSAAQLRDDLSNAGFIPLRSFYRDRGSDLAVFDSHATRLRLPPGTTQYWDAIRQA